MLSVTKEQFGKYSCEASNRHGTDSQPIVLYESQIAICPPVCGNINLNAASRALTPWAMCAALALLTLTVFNRLS